MRPARAGLLVVTLLTVLTAGTLLGCGKRGGGADKWADHMGDIPFVLGNEKGMRQAAATARQPMYFFTATW